MRNIIAKYLAPRLGLIMQALLLLFTFSFVVAAFGQTDTAVATDPGTVVVTDPPPAESPLMQFFTSVSGLVMLTMVVTGWITSRAKSMSATLKQIVSWLIAIGLCFFAQAKGFGLLADADTITTALYGIGVAMVSNNFFDAGTLDNILVLLLAKKKQG